MERTYNVFVDNGLFVVSHYYNKKITEVTLEDIMNSTEHFAKEFAKYYMCSKDSILRKIAFGLFQNSQYTQDISVKSEEDKYNKVKVQYDLLLNNIGNEYCPVCGNNTMSYNMDEELIKAIGKTMCPTLSSNTFFNYANNLKYLNICPVCLYLAMLSYFNVIYVNGQSYLVEAEEDLYMYRHTKNRHVDYERDYITKRNYKKSENGMNEVSELILKMILDSQIFRGYINIVKVFNSTQGESYEDHILSNKDIKFIELLKDEGLLLEFKSIKTENKKIIKRNLLNQLIMGELQRNYLYYITNKGLRNVSEELFNLIEEEYCRMDKRKLELIKEISPILLEKENKIIDKLNSISKPEDFERLLLKYDIPFKSIDDFDSLCYFKEYKQVINRIKLQINILLNESEEM